MLHQTCRMAPAIALYDGNISALLSTMSSGTMFYQVLSLSLSLVSALKLHEKDKSNPALCFCLPPCSRVALGREHALRLTCQIGTHISLNGPNGNAYLLIQLALVFNSLCQPVLYLWPVQCRETCGITILQIYYSAARWGGNMNECQWMI